MIGCNKFILVDIDHTLSDAAWRDPMIGGEGGWDAYHAASIDDKPAEDVVGLINLLQRKRSLSIVGITARPEKWRNLTMSWLLKNSVFLDELLMREDEDFRPAPALKIALAKQRFGETLTGVVAVLDDRDDVTAAFKSLNITVLQVHGRKY